MKGKFVRFGHKFVLDIKMLINFKCLYIATSRVTIALLFLVSTELCFGSSNEVIRELSSVLSNREYSEARVLARKLIKQKLSGPIWTEVRGLLHEHPQVGWDIVTAWDRIKPRSATSLAERSVDRLIQFSGEALLEGQSRRALRGFLRAAHLIRPSLNAVKDGMAANLQLYYFVLQMTGQALFSLERFDEALKVNLWIPPIYMNFRQVLFERAWYAFRAGRVDLTNGALASQYSSYFGWIEPESWLVQIYIAKKMCRQKDFDLILGQVKRFARDLETGQFGLNQWLKSSISTRAFSELLASKASSQSDLVSIADLKNESDRLRSSLERQFLADRKRLLRELERVQAYAQLAVSASAKELPPVPRLAPPRELFRSGLELWPVSDGEDWLDELGNHVYIGDSQCQRS